MEMNSIPRVQRTAWVCMGLGLACILWFRLAPALLAGLLLFSLLHHVDAQLQRWRIAEGRRSRFLALGILGIIGLLIGTGIVLILAFLWRARTTVWPELLSVVARTLEHAQTWLGQQWISADLTDATNLGEKVGQAVKYHAMDFRTTGGHVGKAFIHVLAGLVIGVLVAFHHPASTEAKPLVSVLCGQVKKLSGAFEKVVYAQVRISAINTAFSALYLFVLLPLFHIHLPMRLTLVVITFLAGLLPIVGNVFSNTLIVLLSLGAGPAVALISLGYLVVIHKLEYFLNAHIVGGRIHAKAWEVLIAMLIMEAIFGLEGLVMAPIVYAYLKGELREAGWV
jgi:predicted PurR-regulated permease PerM